MNIAAQPIDRQMLDEWRLAMAFAIQPGKFSTVMTTAEFEQAMEAWERNGRK